MEALCRHGFFNPAALKIKRAGTLRYLPFHSIRSRLAATAGQQPVVTAVPMVAGWVVDGAWV